MQIIDVISVKEYPKSICGKKVQRNSECGEQEMCQNSFKGYSLEKQVQVFYVVPLSCKRVVSS